MEVATKPDFDLPDGWELVRKPKLIPIVGVNQAWLAVYHRDNSMLTVLIGQYSRVVINWCYTP